MILYTIMKSYVCVCVCGWVATLPWNELHYTMQVSRGMFVHEWSV